MLAGKVDVFSLGELPARQTLRFRVDYTLKTLEKRVLPERNCLSVSVFGYSSVQNQSGQDCAIAGACAAFLIKDPGFQ